MTIIELIGTVYFSIADIFRRIWAPMFQKVAMINFTEASSQGIYIICHVYKNINIGDFLIQVYQNRLYYYTVIRIYGFKDNFLSCAEEGYNYKIEVDSPLKFDFEVFENLKYGAYFFGKYSENDICSHTIQPNFELLEETGFDQFYRCVIYYKNYNKSLELQNITSILNIFRRYGYNYAYDRKGTKINDISCYVKTQINNRNSVNSIHIASENTQFYVHGVIGFESKCKVNKIDIILPERCHFVNDETNNMLFTLFQEINTTISPFWSYMGNSKSTSRFPHLGWNLPTSVHHINYYNRRLINEIRNIFQVDLPEYLICRDYPFNNLLQNDLHIQQDFYYRYKFDEMSRYLQKNFFQSRHELLLYCNMLEC